MGRIADSDLTIQEHALRKWDDNHAGIQATKMIRLRNLGTAVIILTAGYTHDSEKEEIVAAGAAALLDKSDLFETLHLSIHEAIKRQNTSFANPV